MQMKFYLKCNEAAHVCDKAQYNEARFVDKVMLKMHLLMCKLCRNYSKRNSALTENIKAADIKTLTAAEKQQIKNRLQQENFGK
jgi:predicted anti-sigma-YlaC factor YlaD